MINGVHKLFLPTVNVSGWKMFAMPVYRYLDNLGQDNRFSVVGNQNYKVSD